MIRIEELETLRRAATQELQRLQGQFESVDLTWSLLGSDAQGNTEEPQTAELRIWFYRYGEPVDFLEFFLFRDGAAVASEEDVRSWIREDAKDVIAKGRRG